MKTLGALGQETKDAPLLTLLNLYEVQAAVGTTWYLTNNIEPVTYAGQEYTPFPITHAEITQLNTGEIQDCTITIGNVTFFVSSFLETHDMRGVKVIVRQTFAEALADGVPALEETYYVDRYDVANDAAVFTLTSVFDVLGKYIPGRSFTRELCPFIPVGRYYRAA